MADTDTARALEVLRGIAAGPWHVDMPTKGYVRVIGNLDCDAHDDGTPKYTHTHICDVIDNDDEDAHARAIAVTPQFVALFAAAVGLEKARNTPVELDIHDTETGEPDHPDDKPTHSSDWAHHDWHERVQVAEQKLWDAIANVTKGVLGHE